MRAVVFDLDGTLVDSRRDLADAANELLVECGAPPLAEATIGRMVGDGAATLVARVFVAAELAPPPDALPRFLSMYDRRLLAHTHSYDGIETLLASLRVRFALGVLTNKPLGATRRILDGLGLAVFFEPAHVFGGDGPFPRKPDPGGLVQLARTLQAPLPKTLLVGDSVVDWRTARAAGARVCIARYGFGFDGFPPGALATSDLAIERPADLGLLL